VAATRKERERRETIKRRVKMPKLAALRREGEKIKHTTDGGRKKRDVVDLEDLIGGGEKRSFFFGPGKKGEKQKKTNTHQERKKKNNTKNKREKKKTQPKKDKKRPHRKQTRKRREGEMVHVL